MDNFLFCQEFLGFSAGFYGLKDLSGINVLKGETMGQEVLVGASYFVVGS